MSLSWRAGRQGILRQCYSCPRHGQRLLILFLQLLVFCGRMMHAVIVDADVSYPPTSGKRLRTLHLMLRLAKRHRVTYIGRGDATQPEVAEARRFLGERDIETLIVDHPVPQKKGLAFYGRLAV